MSDWMSHIESFFVYNEAKPFLFTQIVFWFFFAAILLGYSFFYKNFRWRALFLLISSCFFYYKTSGLFLLLLIFSVLFNYSVGRKIAESKVAKRWMITGVVVNLLILGYFKYAYFFTNTYNQLFDSHFQVVNWLAKWHNNWLGTHFDVDNIILPVGISFFTFQAVSYLLDLYWKKIQPEKNLLYFGFYLSFFPQLVAGPIVRAATFLPQIRTPYRVTKTDCNHAFFMLSKGLVKKIVISDFIAVNFVDRVFDAPHLYSGVESVMALYGYALQIYCDFSGYSNMAIGLALLLGFRLPYNFNSPYKAHNLTNFWHRWHISLSLWLRDYLYIPLGGNRKSAVRTDLNLVVTMLLGGLWHGAHLRFIIWGLAHGLGLIIQKWWAKLISNRVKITVMSKWVGMIITFHFVTLLWLIFRVESWQKLQVIFYQIKTYFWPESIAEWVVQQYQIIGMMVLGFLLHWLPTALKEKLRGYWVRSPWWGMVLILYVVGVLLFVFSQSEQLPFIYFRF
jgi:D-alanyl-lipoteichoic acid acyltransferase DltB (MBOAT superfamily)